MQILSPTHWTGTELTTPLSLDTHAHYPSNERGYIPPSTEQSTTEDTCANCLSRGSCHATLQCV